MPFHKEIWTYLIVTLVTVLIWFWAAGETRETVNVDYARLRFVVSDQENWIISPAQQSVALILEGSKLALQEAENVLRHPIEIDVDATPGRQSIQIVSRLRLIPSLQNLGVSVTASDPDSIELEMDRMERLTVPVKAILPGVTPEGEVVIEPADVIVTLPSSVRGRLPQDFAIEAAAERSELDRLIPGAGVRHTFDLKLRLPEGGAFNGEESVRITPPRAKLTFAIRSRTRETVLETVRVQLAAPPEDAEKYLIEIEPQQLTNVTISGDADLIRRIEAEEVPVIAVLHLSAGERGSKIESKPISYFIALVPSSAAGNGAGGINGTPVTPKFDGSTEMPRIKLQIRDR